MQLGAGSLRKSQPPQDHSNVLSGGLAVARSTRLKHETKISPRRESLLQALVERLGEILQEIFCVRSSKRSCIFTRVNTQCKFSLQRYLFFHD